MGRTEKKTVRSTLIVGTMIVGESTTLYHRDLYQHVVTVGLVTEVRRFVHRYSIGLLVN